MKDSESAIPGKRVGADVECARYGMFARWASLDPRSIGNNARSSFHNLGKGYPWRATSLFKITHLCTSLPIFVHSSLLDISKH